MLGEPPLTSLTRWRMTLAADLLAGRDAATVAEVAVRVPPALQDAHRDDRLGQVRRPGRA